MDILQEKKLALLIERGFYLSVVDYSGVLVSKGRDVDAVAEAIDSTRSCLVRIYSCKEKDSPRLGAIFYRYAKCYDYTHITLLNSIFSS